MKPVRARLYRPGALQRWAKMEAEKRARTERIFESTYARLLKEARTRGEQVRDERDEAKRHGVKTRAFADDLRRKSKLRKVMPAEGEGTVVRATLASEGDAGSGEISRLLSEPEAREQGHTLGKGKPDGMGRPGEPYEGECAECGEAHSTTAHAAVARKQAKEAVDVFHREFTGLEPVYRGDPSDVRAIREAAPAIKTFDEAMGWPAGMDADVAAPDDSDAPDEETGREREGGLAKDDPAVNYRYASDPEKSCGECAHFREPAACELVAGMILKTDTCDLFEPAGEGGDDEQEDES